MKVRTITLSILVDTLKFNCNTPRPIVDYISKLTPSTSPLPQSPPAVDRVTGHTKGCARERACPKVECMWTPKQSFPVPNQKE